MDLTPDRSRLRYVDAGDLDDATVDFDGLDVRSATGEKLGDVDGVIVDVATGRPYYVVVDSGGWFRSKLFLLPIGHARLDHDNDALVAGLTRERIERFPGFDRDSFDELSEDELDRMDEQIAGVCCADETRAAGASARSERWSHYRQPDWWNPISGHPASETRSESREAATRTRDVERERVGEAEAVVAREGGEASPHLGGRAQPGDVIGVETGGERTYLSDTAEDENDRRRSAEKAAGKQAEDDLEKGRRK